MRDGQGNKLSPEEIDKVKAAGVKPDETSLNRVSIDPGPNSKPELQDGSKTQPAPATAPRF